MAGPDGPTRGLTEAKHEDIGDVGDHCSGEQARVKRPLKRCGDEGTYQGRYLGQCGLSHLAGERQVRSVSANLGVADGGLASGDLVVIDADSPPMNDCQFHRQLSTSAGIAGARTTRRSFAGLPSRSWATRV